jgi:hypothetical protein
MTALESRNRKIYENSRSLEKEHLKYTNKYNTVPVTCLHLRLYARFHGAYIIRTKENKYCDKRLDQKKINGY